MSKHLKYDGTMKVLRVDNGSLLDPLSTSHSTVQDILSTMVCISTVIHTFSHSELFLECVCVFEQIPVCSIIKAASGCTATAVAAPKRLHENPMKTTIKEEGGNKAKRHKRNTKS